MTADILRAQWRSMRTFRTGSNTASTALSFLSGLLFYGFWAGIAFGAEEFFANPENAQYFSIALSIGLSVVFLYWQVTPVITASMGASLDLKKLRPYPIPRGGLFRVEVLLRLTTCAEMILVLAGVVIGLVRDSGASGPVAPGRILAGAVLFVIFNLLLSAGLRNLLERILLRRRVREFLFFLLILVSVGPSFLLRSGFASGNFRNAVPETLWLPWTAASHLLLGANALLSLSILLGFTALAYGFGRWQFERSWLAEPALSAPRSIASAERWEILFRMPSRLLPDPWAAIMEKELRSMVRTPPFRMIFIMGAAFGLLIWLPNMLRHGKHPSGFMAENVLTLATVYGILALGQVSYFNCFGFDRSATLTWFAIPVPIGRVLVAKNLAVLVFVVIEILTVSLTGLVFRIGVTPGKFVEALSVALVAALYLIAFGNLASVRLPRVLDPEKINQGGSTKALNVLILLFLPVVLLPVGLAYWGRSVFESQLVFVLLMTLAAVFGCIVYWVGLTSAIANAYARREQILGALSQSEGPLSIS